MRADDLRKVLLGRAVERFPTAAIELAHGRERLPVGNAGLEGQSLVQHDLVQQHGNGIGRADADPAQYALGPRFQGPIHTRIDVGSLGHWRLGSTDASVYHKRVTSQYPSRPR